MGQKKFNYSFLPGTQKVTKEDYNKLKNDLMKVLGCNSTQYYYRKRKCIPNIPVNIKEDIEKVFNKYGISDSSEIWQISEVEKT